MHVGYRAVRVLLAIVLAAATPAVHHTSAGTKAARASLLKPADLGKGWTAAAAPRQQGVPLTCTGHDPSAKGIVETGAASSPAFSATQAGPFVQQNTSVFASAAEAGTWWRRAVTPTLVRCAAGTFAALRARGVKVSVVSQSTLPVSTGLPHTAAFRVVAKANGKKLYFDLIVLGSGRAITGVTVSSFLQPVPAKYERALAVLIARRLGGGGA
jgi:hypothetical protein